MCSINIFPHSVTIFSHRMAALHLAENMAISPLVETFAVLDHSVTTTLQCQQQCELTLVISYMQKLHFSCNQLLAQVDQNCSCIRLLFLHPGVLYRLNIKEKPIRDGQLPNDGAINIERNECDFHGGLPPDTICLYPSIATVDSRNRRSSNHTTRLLPVPVIIPAGQMKRHKRRHQLIYFVSSNLL